MIRSSKSLGILLRLDVRRLLMIARRPTAAVWIGVLLPAALLAAGLRAAGSVGRADLSGTQGGVTLGVLLSGPIAFAAYGTLFRGGDDGFLRRLGVAPAALFWERGLRLLAWGACLVILSVLAYTGASVGVGRALSVSLPATFAAWGGALLASSLAARSTAGGAVGKGWGLLTAGLRDSEMTAAAPLIYAPLLPLIAGALAGGVVAGMSRPAIGAAVILAGSLAAAWAARGAYVQALPRFAPRALEMSFAPHPSGEGEGLRMRRGIARLLPRRAAAAWARDGAVASRRFAWAARVTWPVVIFSLVALARWGGHPGTSTWVASAAGLVLVLQAAAAIGLGRIERRQARWLDRAVGISPAQRFLGRWAWGWGLSLWLAVPLSLAWSWWAAAGAGWPWLLVGGGTSGVAALASAAAAGRR